MLLRKLCPVIVAIVILAMMTPAFGSIDLVRNRTDITEPGDDHPWGGEGYEPGGGGAPLLVVCVGSTITLIQLFNLNVNINTRDDLPLIRGTADTNPSNIPTNNNASGTSQRGN